MWCAHSRWNLWRKVLRGKFRGQSVVEFTLVLPLILLLISGLVEFGFMINAYLDLVDTAREVARFASDADPDDGLSFYQEAEDWGLSLIETGIGQIQLDRNADDLIVSVFQFSGTSVVRYPNQGSDPRCGGEQNGGEMGYRLFCHHVSEFSNSKVESELSNIHAQLSAPPDTGVVLVEVFYDYNMKLALPWITAFLPNPITLHAYAFAPNGRIGN